MPLQLKSKFNGTMFKVPDYSPKLEQDLKEKIDVTLKKMEGTSTCTQRERFGVANDAVKEITDLLTECYQALQEELKQKVEQNLLHPKVIEKYPHAILNLFKQLTTNVQKSIAIENAPIVDRALSNYWNNNKTKVEEHPSSGTREENSFRSINRRFF
jgi:predicted HNH restriction endonuclease